MLLIVTQLEYLCEARGKFYASGLATLGPITMGQLEKEAE